MNAFDILKQRGFVEQTTRESALRRLLESGKITAYIGFDPSAPSLHIGNFRSLMAAVHLQLAGHKPIILLGGATGLIGDPSDKDKTRPLLSGELVKQNVRRLKEQIIRIFGPIAGKPLILNNADWLTKLNYIEFLRIVGSQISINRLLGTEWVKKRLRGGLSFLEFSYQLLQAYDFWYLFKNYGCILQLGGSDQWANILAGIDLIRRLENKEAHGITMPLLITGSGKKMGKSEKGAIWLDPQLTTPYEFYQYWINTDDRDVKKFLPVFTLLSQEEIKKLGKLKGEKIRTAKEILSYEVTKIVHGEEEARQAQEASRLLFGKQKRISEYMPTFAIKKSDIESGLPAFKIFHLTGLAASLSEARRLINQGGGYVNETRIKNPDFLIEENIFKDGEILLRAGKKKHLKVKII